MTQGGGGGGGERESCLRAREKKKKKKGGGGEPCSPSMSASFFHYSSIWLHPVRISPSLDRYLKPWVLQ